MFGITKITKTSSAPRITILPREFGSVSVTIGFNKGAFDQPADKIGLAHFAEHLIIKESVNYPDLHTVDSKLTALGVDYNAQTSIFMTLVKINVPDSTDLYTVLDIFLDKIFNPLLTQDRIDKERRAIITELRSRKQNIGGYGPLLASNALVGLESTDYSFTGGSEAIIKSITREDITKYIKSSYTKENMQIFVAGAVDSVAVQDYLENKLQSYSSSVDLLKTKPYFKLDKSCSIAMKNPDPDSKLDISQDIFPFRATTPKDMACLQVLRRYLTGPRSALLSRVLRSQKGLIYGVRNWPIYSPYNDYLVLAYEAAHENLAKFTRAKQDIYAELSKGQIDPELFKATRESIIKSTNKLFESTDVLVDFWSIYQLSGKTFGYDEVYTAIKKLSLQDLIKFSKSVFKTSPITVNIY